MSNVAEPSAVAPDPKVDLLLPVAPQLYDVFDFASKVLLLATRSVVMNLAQPFKAGIEWTFTRTRRVSDAMKTMLSNFSRRYATGLT